MTRGAFVPAACAAALLALAAAPASPAPPSPSAPAPAPPAAPGDILVAVRATTVRTRGAGNMRVDLPRGRAVRVVRTRPDAILLEPAPADAVRLRSFGVRRLPRYTAAPAQVAADFLPRAAWREHREAAIAGVRARWPDLDETRAAAIFAGEPYVGMSAEQAEAAVGEVVLERRPAGADGGEIWVIGARSRSAELRLYTEGRERGLKTVSFEDYLGGRALAVLTFRDGRLTDIGTP